MIDREFRRITATDGCDDDILVVTAPPRHGKSTYLAHWAPVQYLGMRPNNRVTLCSYGASLAKLRARQARDRYHSLAPLFSNQGVNPTAAKADDWETLEGGGMMSSGVKGGVTGRGADLILIDDYIRSAADARSPTIREANWEWFRATVSTRREPGAKIIVLATPWHKDDLIGMILSKAEELELQVRHIQLQAEYDGQIVDPLHRHQGEALWPERWPIEALAKQRRLLGSYWWHALYMGNPGLFGDAEWPAEYFSNIWAQDDEWPERCVFSAVALDPSKAKSGKKTKTKQSDYQAMVYTGYHDRRLWVDADIDRRTVPQMMKHMARFCKERQPAIVGIEANAFQDLLAPDYIAACEELDYHQTDPTLINNSINKEVRILRISTYLEQHQIKIRRNAGGERLVEQLKAFPSGAHDDGPDALEMSLRLIAMLTGTHQGEPMVTETPV